MVRLRVCKLLTAMLVSGACLLSAQAAQASPPAISLYYGPANVSGHTSFSNWLGVPLNYATDYVPYTNGWSTDFDPTWLLNAWGPWVRASAGRRMVLGVPLLENGYAGQFSQEAAGAFDQYFTKLAQVLVANGLGGSILRLGYEANNPSIGPWQATDDPSGFISAYRHVVAVLRAVPGTSFTFDWNPNAGLTANKPLNSLASFYPGDDVVDIVGLDVYDIYWSDPGATPQQRWNFLLTEPLGLQDQQSFAAAHGKPVSYPEWGLYSATGAIQGGGGDDPYYVDQMANWLATNNTAYQSYFNYDFGGGVLSNFPNAQARYLADFGSGGTPPPAATPPTVTLNAPTAGALFYKTLSFSASASDSQGIARVEFWVDGTKVATVYNAPYSYTWSVSKKLTYAQHTVTVKAYDSAGLSSSASVTVTRSTSA